MRRSLFHRNFPEYNNICLTKTKSCQIFAPNIHKLRCPYVAQDSHIALIDALASLYHPHPCELYKRLGYGPSPCSSNMEDLCSAHFVIYGFAHPCPHIPSKSKQFLVFRIIIYYDKFEIAESLVKYGVYRFLYPF